MKKTLRTLLFALLASATFCACGGGSEEVPSLPPTPTPPAPAPKPEVKQTEVKLASIITPPSRGTNLNQQSTQIAANQQVGVTVTGAKTAHNNVAWKVGANGAMTNTGSTLYYGTGQATIKAYHPYNQEWSGQSATFSVAKDQSTDAGYLGSDLLWATATSAETTEAVVLNFTHKLAKINVTLTSSDFSDLSGATISICGTNLNTGFNPQTGALAAATANKANIKAGVTTANAYTAAAIIVPQTVGAATELVKVTYGGKTYAYPLPAAKTFESGKSYSYTLDIKEKLVVLTLVASKITNWQNENLTGSLEEVD